MLAYSYRYNHKTKEVIAKVQIGFQPPVDIVMGAEAFTQDIEFMANDKKLAHFLSEVKRRKDLPTDYDFGKDAEIKFDEGEWDQRMKE